jgi:hypothetical protein
MKIIIPALCALLARAYVLSFLKTSRDLFAFDVLLLLLLLLWK